jgi:hypothetical protein
MYSGGIPEYGLPSFGDVNDFSSPLDYDPNTDPFEPGSPYASSIVPADVGQNTPLDLADPLSSNTPILSANEIVANAADPAADPAAEDGLFKDAEGEITDVGYATIKAGGDILSTLVSDAMRDDPEPPKPVYRAPRFRAQPQQTQFSGIGAQQAATGGTVLGRQLFLGGGEVEGPGGPKEDVVPIWASDQEYVVSANGVKRLGGGSHRQGIQTLDRINFGKS